MAGKPECDTGESKERDRAEPGLSDSRCGSRRWYVSSRNTSCSSTLALACPESVCQQA